MINKPIISVVIPCHNKSETIARAIKSVKAQTLTNFECIIVYDNDTNSEKNALKAIGDDDRFSSISVSNGNVADTRNDGIEKAKGIYKDIIQKYPNTEIAKNLIHYLAFISKTDEEKKQFLKTSP